MLCSRTSSASVCDAAEDEIASAAGETTLLWTGCLVLWLAARRLLVVPMDDDDVTLKATLGEELRTERVSWRRATVVDVEWRVGRRGGGEERGVWWTTMGEASKYD